MTIKLNRFGNMNLKSLAFFLAILCSAASMGQTGDYTKDVKTKEAIVAALYEVISGSPQQPRNWERFRNLFRPDSRLIPTNKNLQGDFTIRFITPDEYVQLFSNNIKTGFFEKELHQKVESYGTIAHVFSTYETREMIDGPVTNRGINSIQLFYNNERYYIVNIFWCAESMGFPIPPNYTK